MSASYIDYQEVKAANPIEKVAEALGMKLKKSGNQFRCPCPSGQGGERAFVITPSKGLFYSFATQEGGDVLKLVEIVNNCTTKEAARFLQGDTEPLETRSQRASTERSDARGGFRPLDYLDPDHPAVEALGMEPATATALGIGYAPRGVLRGTVAVPVRREDGAIAGYIGIEEATLPPKWQL